jgi:putative phosphoesterase
MRIGIISDVHGNAPGLQQALSRLGNVDEVFCLGDIVEDFRFSNEACAQLAGRDVRCVLGNHDIGLLGSSGTRAREASTVDQRRVRWLAEQSLTIETVIGGKRILMTHASPFAPHTDYVWKHSPGLKQFATIDADYVLIGHTHAQMAHRVGKVMVINPGSVGQPIDHNNGRLASYAILDTSTDEVTFDNYELAPAGWQMEHL